jgi:hypothetical protein
MAEFHVKHFGETAGAQIGQDTTENRNRRALSDAREDATSARSGIGDLQ